MSKTVILLPTYNERENVGLIIPEIFAAHPDIYVTVIDDNSPDRTSEVVHELIQKYPNLSLLKREKKEGLGAAYKHGIRHVMSFGGVDRIITMDADGSHAVKHLASILEASKTHHLVVGSRYVGDGGASWVLWRRLLSAGGNFYTRILTGLPIRDITAGYICLRSDLLERMDLDRIGASGYAFLIDLKFHAIRDVRASVQEVPIWFGERRGGESKISSHIVREGLYTPLRLLWRRFSQREQAGPKQLTYVAHFCHICGSADIRFYCRKGTYRLYQCHDCNLAFVYPMPGDLSAIYTEDYFRNVDKKSSHGYADYDKDKEPMRAAFERALAKAERLTHDRKIFDIGAATGYFLDIARDRAWQTQGSEISEYGANEAAKRGHGMIYGDLTTKDDLPKVDMVTMWDVIEHVGDPRALCQTVNRMLPQDGYVMINTPDIDSVWARLLRGYWQLIVPPEHVYYYAPRNIRMLLGQTGFEVVEMSRMSKTFSLPYIFKILAAWQGFAIWHLLARTTDNPLLRRIKLPINLRDNMFVIARKVYDA